MEGGQKRGRTATVRARWRRGARDLTPPPSPLAPADPRANTAIAFPPPPQNRRNTPDRLELKKYNRFLRRVTLHRELKK